jgi:hypothetical protein
LPRLRIDEPIRSYSMMLPYSNPIGIGGLLGALAIGGVTASI